MVWKVGSFLEIIKGVYFMVRYNVESIVYKLIIGNFLYVLGKVGRWLVGDE